MKKKTGILIILFFAILNAKGQDVITIEKTNQSKLKEKYSVLKSDTLQKHGKYELFNQSDSLLIKGNYSSNSKIGTWEYYNDDGDLELRYDYLKTSLLYYKPKKSSKEYTIIQGIDTLKSFLDRYPVAIGKIIWVMENPTYPELAKNNNISGIVIVAYTVDNHGEIKNFRVKKGIGYGCDEEAIRIAKINIIDNIRSYIPAVLNNKTVNVEIEYPVRFELL